MFTDPVKNLKLLGLREDMIVADLGAGNGYYTLPVAHILTKGKVYAVEIQHDFLKTILRKSHDAKLENIECIWGNIEKGGGTKIADGVVDVVIVSNVFCQVEDKNAVIKEAKRILKPHGRVLLVEIDEGGAILPRSHNMCIPKQTLHDMFMHEGFLHERDIDTGHHHYGMIYTKQ
jgi:ubiquinone/menaquinone biosynthesis C-methylase UbiE